jgi:hypothetical protein
MPLRLLKFDCESMQWHCKLPQYRCEPIQFDFQLYNATVTLCNAIAPVFQSYSDEGQAIAFSSSDCLRLQHNFDTVLALVLKDFIGVRCLL